MLKNFEEKSVDCPWRRSGRCLVVHPSWENETSLCREENCGFIYWGVIKETEDES